MKSPLLLLLFLLTSQACQQGSVEPAGCSFVAILDDDSYTFQLDEQSRVTDLARRSARTNRYDVDYHYTYEAAKATIELTYPHSDWLRFHYELTLNEQGYLLTALETMFFRSGNGTLDQKVTGDYTCAYDEQGYLIRYGFNRYSYPILTNQKTLAQTQDATLRYQAGNPVLVTSDQGRDTLVNEYGTQPNPAPFPWLLEAGPASFTPDMALRPLLGKPSRTAITRAEWRGTRTMTLTYGYHLDVQGQLQWVGRDGPVAPHRFTFSQACP